MWPLLIQKLDGGVTQLSSTDHTIPGSDDHSLALSTEAVMLGPGQTLELVFGLGGTNFSGCPSSPCPWDCEALANGVVGTSDLLSLLAGWGGVNSCDFDGAGVGTSDLLKLLANWGPCE